MVKIRDELLAAKYIAGAYNAAHTLGVQVSAGTREVTVRDLTPVDLGATGYDWTQAAPASAGWNTVYSGTVPTSKAYVIYGFANVGANKVVTAVRITVGSNDVRLIVLQDLYDGSKYGERTFLTFDDQIGIRESMAYKIDYYYNATSDSQVVILGFVAEPVGYTIQKKSEPIAIAGATAVPKVTAGTK